MTEFVINVRAKLPEGIYGAARVVSALEAVETKITELLTEHKIEATIHHEHVEPKKERKPRAVKAPAPVPASKPKAA